MKFFLLLAASLSTSVIGFAAEPDAIEFFKSKAARITLDAEGHATKIMHGGKPELTVAELNRLGELTHLQELALNMPPAGDDDWGFLKKLTKLKKLTIWHGHHFSTLAQFSGLPVESILFGGCMGLRDLNKETPQKQRDVVLTLKNLPNLKSLTLYHSPLTPDDSHIAHFVKEFPKLTAMQLDFNAPRNQKTKITPDGLGKLTSLKLEKLTLEGGELLSPETFAAFGKITTLQKIHIHPSRKDYDGSVAAYQTRLVPVKKTLPELEVTLQPARKPKK